MTREERVQRAKGLIELVKSDHWPLFLSLVKDKSNLAFVLCYSSNDPYEMAKYAGQAKALDTVPTFIQDEVRIVKRMIEEGRVK